MKIEVSLGEILDKLSILAIKEERISNPSKLENVKLEKSVLEKTLADEYAGPKMDDLYIELKRVNERLWDIEDDIRKKEKAKEFDDTFIQLARSVYFTNDERSKIKRKINIAIDSDLIEEKDYEEYT